MKKSKTKLIPDQYYGCGTIIKVVYFHDGIKENQTCILANTFEEPYLFQVISIDGYNAGSIEGYIKRQFDLKMLDITNCCTGLHLQNELYERVFQNIESIYSVK